MLSMKNNFFAIRIAVCKNFYINLPKISSRTELLVISAKVSQFARNHTNKRH